MQMQDLSYTLNNEHIKCDFLGYPITLSMEMFSKENVYTSASGSLTKEGDIYHTNRVLWGDTEETPNSSMSLRLSESSDKVTFSLSGKLDKPILGMKLRFDDLPLGKLLTLSEEDVEINEYGHLYRYPEGWRTLSYPLTVFKLKDGKYLCIRVMHEDVIPVSFFIKKTGEDKMRMDLTIEAIGHELVNTYNSCPIEMSVSSSLEEIYNSYSEHIKTTFKLVDYKDNKDVPSWMEDVSLVVIMHMEAFTGHIFHTYQKALDDVKKLCEHIEGKRILVYIAGWEGRYYYKYGNYTPDDRLGGADELKKMVDGIHELGGHVLAMYGMNFANKDYFSTQDFEDMEFITARGGKFRYGSVDWEGSHSYDFCDFGNFNPGMPKWQNHIYNQIKNSSLEFNFDGAFLDIVACYVNDQRVPVFKGLEELCSRLRTIKNDYLIAGEGYYDGLSKIIPLFQSGHTDGKMNYHDRVSPILFTRFSREFAHLCLGDLSRGSTGVHEQGTNTDTKTPVREGVIPTLTLVEDTTEKAMDKVIEVIDDAKEYAKRYL